MADLVLKNLTVGYDKILIDEINLEIPKRKLITILGENGVGKSTLMYTLLKIIQPLSGSIQYQNSDISEFNPKKWSNVFAAVFSGVQNIPHISVKDLIKIGSNKESDATNVAELLEINSILNQFVDEISDGQLQKVLIARAIMQNTPYVIFDEPTAHLDFKNKRKIFDLLKNIIQQTDKTFIIITHEILQALSIADETWWIQDKKLYSGLPKDIDLQFNIKEQVLQNINYES